MPFLRSLFQGGFEMSWAYAESRVRAALEEAEGNALQTKRLLLEWIEKDTKLLHGLAEPHMNAIITHAIGYVTREKQEGDRIVLSPEQPGIGLVQGIVEGRGGSFGRPPDGTIPPPGKTSERHVEAIHILAAGGKGKQKKE